MGEDYLGRRADLELRELGPIPLPTLERKSRIWGGSFTTTKENRCRKSASRQAGRSGSWNYHHRRAPHAPSNSGAGSRSRGREGLGRGSAKKAMVAERAKKRAEKEAAEQAERQRPLEGGGGGDQASPRQLFCRWRRRLSRKGGGLRVMILSLVPPSHPARQAARRGRPEQERRE